MGDTGIWGWQTDEAERCLYQDSFEDIEEPDQLQSTMVRDIVTSLNSHNSNVNLDSESFVPSVPSEEDIKTPPVRDCQIEHKAINPLKIKNPYGVWRKPGSKHNNDCTDPFCEGCYRRFTSNNSQCYTTNVVIKKVTPHKLEGSSEIGDVYIHKKYLAVLKKKTPPGINLVGKSFKMIVMKNAHSIAKTPSIQLRCIWIDGNPMAPGIVIYHRPGEFPSMLDAKIWMSYSYYDNMKTRQKYFESSNDGLVETINNMSRIIQKKEDENRRLLAKLAIQKD